MVGHSYGNIAIVYYMLQHGSDTSLPKLVQTSGYRRSL